MTVLLVLLTVITLLTIEYFYSKKRAMVPILTSRSLSSAPLAALNVQTNIVDGFQVPGHLRYHPGHTWALSESPNLIRAGLDQFAARLIGKADKVALPQRGQWVRQGQKIWTLFREGKKVEMVSPIEGEITDINEAVLQNPQLALRDPYGEGWLIMVKSPDAKTNFRNLLSGNMIRRWIEESAARLRSRMPAVAGAVAQDGGVAIDDLSTCLTEEAWKEMTQEFFLS